MEHEPLADPDFVQRTLGVYAALNARDFEAIMGMFGPAAVWDVSRWGLGTHAGLDAIGHFLEDWFGTLDDYEVQVEEIHGLGGGVVQAVVEQIAHRAGVRGVLVMRSAPVFVWGPDARIAQLTLYRDTEEARARAEGLVEAHRRRSPEGAAGYQA